MFRSLLIAAAVTNLAAPASAQVSPQRRLTPADIAALPRTGPSNGVQTTILAGDPKQPGPYTIVVSYPPHSKIGPHTHRDNRASIIVSGEWFVGYGPVAEEGRAKALGVGGFYTEPAGQPHWGSTHDQPAVVYVTGMGPSDTVFLTAP